MYHTDESEIPHLPRLPHSISSRSRNVLKSTLDLERNHRIEVGVYVVLNGDCVFKKVL